MKKVLVVIVALILMLTLAGCGGTGGDEEPAEKEARTADSYNTVEEGGLSFQIPDYFGEPEMSGDVKNYYAETGNSLTALQMYSADGILDEDNFESDSNEMYDSYLAGFENSDDVTDLQNKNSDDATIGCGLHCMIYNYSFMMTDVDCNCVLTFINNTEANKVITVSLIQSEQSEYDYYDAYAEMVDKCEIVDTKAETTEEPDSAADSGSDSGLLSPDFKKTMDDYEAWFDHYCEVMKKYEENPSDIELLSEMSDLLTEEATMLEEMENMDQSEMNTAELAYYLEVTARIEKKLLEVAY